MENNFTLAGETFLEQKTSVPHGMSYVGFKPVLAPINKNVQTRVQNASNSARIRHVQELLGGTNASTQVAPGFSDCFRFLLEQQQIADEEIRLALKELDPPKRYEIPFKKLYVILKSKGVNPLQASIMKIATNSSTE